MCDCCWHVTQLASTIQFSGNKPRAPGSVYLLPKFATLFNADTAHHQSCRRCLCACVCDSCATVGMRREYQLSKYWWHTGSRSVPAKLNYIIFQKVPTFVGRDSHCLLGLYEWARVPMSLVLNSRGFRRLGAEGRRGSDLPSIIIIIVASHLYEKTRRLNKLELVHLHILSD